MPGTLPATMLGHRQICLPRSAAVPWKLRRAASDTPTECREGSATMTGHRAALPRTLRRIRHETWDETCPVSLGRLPDCLGDRPRAAEHSPRCLGHSATALDSDRLPRIPARLPRTPARLSGTLARLSGTRARLSGTPPSSSGGAEAEFPRRSVRAPVRARRVGGA